MLRSLHTVSSGARHAIQPHLLSIQLWPRNLNAMQCNAMAQPNGRKNAMSCSVPCIRCPRALAMPSDSTKKGRAFRPFFFGYNAMQCSAVQYTTIQCNAMQCNAMQWHSLTQEKNSMSCSFPRVRYPRALAMLSSSIMQHTR